jgi:cytidylate kinase
VIVRAFNIITIRDLKIYVNEEMARRCIRVAGQEEAPFEVVISEIVMKEYFTIEIA